MQYNSALNELVTLGTDRRLTFWSIEKQKIITQLQADSEADLTSISISPDGQLILLGNEQGEMKLFTAQDHRLIHYETVHSASVTSVAISPDNTLILTGDGNG